MHDVPLQYDLWLDGSIVNTEADEYGSSGNIEIGIKSVWNIRKISIPRVLWDRKEEIIEHIKAAFVAYSRGFNEKYIVSITVNIKAEPECMEVKE